MQMTDDTPPSATAFAVRDPYGKVRLETIRSDRDEHKLWQDYVFKCMPYGENRQGLWLHTQQEIGAEIVEVELSVKEAGEDR